MLKEITISNGKVVRVLEAAGYNDGYYWDMDAVVEIEGKEYTVQDAGSGSGYIPIYESMSVNGPCKLTGVERTEIRDKSEEEYFMDAIKYIAERFFLNDATDSYECCDDTYGHVSVHVDGKKVGSDEEEDD